MNLTTTRFGAIEIDERNLFTFPEGLIGFSNFKRYALYERAKDGPFKWLQCVDNPELAFVITDPVLFISDYRAEVSEAEIASIELKDMKEARVMVIVMVAHDDPAQTRANLRGPLVFNTANNMAKQLVLSEEYPLRYNLAQPRSA